MVFSLWCSYFKEACNSFFALVGGLFEFRFPYKHCIWRHVCPDNPKSPNKREGPLLYMLLLWPWWSLSRLISTLFQLPNLFHVDLLSLFFACPGLATFYSSFSSAFTLFWIFKTVLVDVHSLCCWDFLASQNPRLCHKFLSNPILRLLPNVIKILKSKQLILHGSSFNRFFISAIIIVMPRFMSILYIALEIWHFNFFFFGIY